MTNEHFVSVNADGEIVRGLEAWRRLTGFSEEELTGRRWLDAIEEGDRESIDGLWATGAPFAGEFRLRRRDGPTHWVAARFMRASGGEWLGIISDIDAARRRDEVSARLASFSDDLSPDADERAILRGLAGVAVPLFADWCTVHVLLGDGTIENVAVAGGDGGVTRRLERFSKIASGAPLAIALRTASIQLHAQVDGRGLPEEHLAVDEADGEFLRGLGVSSLIVAPIVVRGSAVGAVRFIASRPERRYDDRDAALASDIARRAALAVDNARARAEALTSGHSRDVFLATLSHEMRTPLTSILGWTQMLRAAGPGSDLFVDALDAIERSAHVQRRLIDDLLDVSRIITGKLHLEFAAVEIGRLLHSALETLAPRATEAGQHIRLASPRSDLTVYGDETRLRQVLWNLLTNAMKYTPPGGLIEITTTTDEDAVTISVRDTGRGIRAEVLPHVFDRFHQATVADSAKHGGLGLGLAIVRNIVERHGGSVAARSPGEGKGATFSVCLPLYRRHS